MTKRIFNIIKATKSTVHWNKFEDELLLRLTKNKKYIRWTQIVRNFKNKSITNCKSRFRIIDQRFRRGRWTPQEDQQLLSLVEAFGKSWKFISKVMKNRNEKQIRSRYVNFIFHGINRDKFTSEEDHIIVDKYSEFKNNYVQYTKYLDKRSPRQIENRFKSLKHLIKN